MGYIMADHRPEIESNPDASLLRSQLPVIKHRNSPHALTRGTHGRSCNLCRLSGHNGQGSACRCRGDWGGRDALFSWLEALFPLGQGMNR